MWRKNGGLVAFSGIVGCLEQFEVLSCVAVLHVLGADIGRLFVLSVDLDKLDFATSDGLAAKPIAAFNVPGALGNIVGFVHCDSSGVVDKDWNGRQWHVFSTCSDKGDDS